MPHVPRLLRGFRRERPVVPGKWDTITHLPSRNEPDADTTPSTPVWAQPQPGSRERPAWAAPDADEIFVRRQLLIVWAEFGLGGYLMDPDQYPPKPPYDPGHPPPDQVPWHSITPAQDPHSPYTGPDMRAMAETFADALATRLAPEPAKPRQVSLQWLRDWLSSPTGRQFIVSALTTGPIGGAALARFTEDTPDAAPFGMVALAFIGFGLVHLAYHKWWSVLLVWGAALSPVYYPPALLSAITMLTGAAS